MSDTQTQWIDDAEKRVAPSLHLRWMIRRDIPAVLGIERLTHESPWGIDDLLDTLKARDAIGLVVETSGKEWNDDGVIAGYVAYKLRPTELKVVRLGVHPEFCDSAVFTMIATRLKGRLGAKHKRDKIRAIIPESALNALLAFKSVGFFAESIVRGDNEDSIEMVYRAKE